MNSQIEQVIRELDANTQVARELTAELTDPQLNWRPDPEKWSVGECLEHLTVTARLYTDPFRDTIADARRRGITGAGPYRRSLFGRVWAWTMEPPVRFRMPAPRQMRPTRQLSMTRVLPDFVTEQTTYRQMLAEMDGLDLAHVKLASPVMRRVRLSLIDWLGIHVAHERRHLWQARGVRTSPGFPAP